MALAERLGTLVAAPMLALLRMRLIGFEAGGQILSLIPGAGGMFVRRAWYRTTLAACGPGLLVTFGAVISHPETRLGAHCYVGKHVLIGLASIGDDFLCSDRVQVLSGNHHHGFEHREIPISRQGDPRLERVTIGCDVWLGANAVVAADVADHCIVGAGAVVVRDVTQPWLMVGGVPAHTLRERP